VLRDEPVARHSQYGVGGPADFYLASSDDGMLRELVVRCAAESVPLTMLGAGSNTLVLDGGIRGLAVRIIDKRVAVQGDHVCLAAGAMMPRVALDLARRGIGGMEWGIGVPGSCGASVWGNAGAFDSDVAGTLVDCDVLAPDGTVQRVRASDCGFAYRDSRLRRDLAGHVVLRGRFAVSHQDVAAVRARTDAIQAERKRTQPYGVRSLGSTFKNPPDDFAGRLIEAAGLKGRTHGGAQISPKHANFILNIANATAADVLALVEVAREAVAERFDVVLEREIVVLGEPATLAIEAVPR
jgi:UDP-N-acetylmuramate dehydrogenase